MSLRTIDSDKCSGCGLCVSDCVNHYLEMTVFSGGKIAAFKERGRCLNCGHCNAICPRSAVIGGEIADVADGQDDLLALMARKRSVRKYIKGAVIPKEVMDKILFAGQSAPTDRNRRSARIVFIKDSLPVVYNEALDYLVAEVQRTGSINPLYVPTMRLNDNRHEVLWNAEYLVVFIGTEQNFTDAAISAERMQLEACSLGVGTAYRGDMRKAINNVDRLRELLEIKKNEEVLVAFAMGVTEIQYLRPAVKINRKVVYI